jgi:hypothetical protein
MSAFRVMRGMSCFALSICVSGFALSQEIPSETPDKKQAEAAANTAEKAIVAPLPAGNAKLDALRARMAKIHESQAAYAKDLADGKAQPFPDVKAAWPSYEEKAKRISTDTLKMEKEQDPAIRTALALSIYTLLQEIGPFLQSADYTEQAPVPLSKTQVSEMARLENAWDEAESIPYKNDETGNPHRLVPISPLYQFTINNLAVELKVKALPGWKVYFDSADGGEFPNGLMLTEVVAGDDGIASVLWVSHGRGVGACEVGVRCPGMAYGMPPFHIEVVKPILEPPSFLTDISNKAQKATEANPTTPQGK